VENAVSREPLVVEFIRGDRVESRHEVDVAIVEVGGRLVRSHGEFNRHVMPRSAAKPFQALPLVVTGAADAFNLGNVELALACGSHGGEPGHVGAVTAWLEHLGLGPEDLACGSHLPMHEPSAITLEVAGGQPDPTMNNCSGKHAGFLTVVCHLGLAKEKYLNPTHPLQADYVTPSIAEACQIDFTNQVPGIDGCGIPVWAVPLDQLATAWAELGASPIGAPAARLLEAMRSEPFHVAGSGRACTDIIRAASGATVVKTGAEGVFCAALPDDRLGLALKVRDGASRAADAAIVHLLAELGRLPASETKSLINRAGTVVGMVRVI
jgi:L-asparaginase II